MIGQGALRECLLAPDVESILVIGRTGTNQKNAKVREILRADLDNLSDIETELAGIDACFFCIGVSAVGKSEETYTAITYDFTLNIARTLARVNPSMTFIYVSGQGTDSSERGRMMWARVKGRTENGLLQLPFNAYMFRPGLIQPMHGIKSKTAVYRITYMVLSPLTPILLKAFPKHVTTTEQLGRAMLRVAREGHPKKVLESADINSL